MENKKCKKCQVYDFTWHVNSVKYTILLDTQTVSSMISYLTRKKRQVWYLTGYVKNVKYDILVDTKMTSRNIILNVFLVSSNGTILDSRLLDAF